MERDHIFAVTGPSGNSFRFDLWRVPWRDTMVSPHPHDERFPEAPHFFSFQRMKGSPQGLSPSMHWIGQGPEALTVFVRVRFLVIKKREHHLDCTSFSFFSRRMAALLDPGTGFLNEGLRERRPRQARS